MPSAADWENFVKNWAMPQLERSRADAVYRGDKNIADGCLNALEKAKRMLDSASGPAFSMAHGSPDVIEYRDRFYINMGRAGFNSVANNTMGYATAQIAQEVIDGKRSRF